MNYNITPKEVYKCLRSNNEVLNIYKKIESEEKRLGGWAFYNFEHVNNVILIAKKVLNDLNFDGRKSMEFMILFNSNINLVN